MVPIAVLFIGGVSCATRHHSAVASGFGVVDPKAPELSPEMLARVNKEQTLAEIFRILGPAHGKSAYAQGVLCWEWRFSNSEMLVIPEDTNPEAKPKDFSIWIVDYAA